MISGGPPCKGGDGGASRRWRLLQVEASMVCNIACRMCPWRGIRAGLPGNGLLSKEIWESLTPHLPQVESIDFTGGGETLLHPDLPEFLRIAKGAGCETGLLTNATLLDRDMALRLLDAGIHWLGVSLDGATEATYESIRRGADFETVTTNLRRLVEMAEGGGPRITVQMVLMEDNAHEIIPMVALAAELGVHRLVFKNCDVIRERHGQGFGLFGERRDRRKNKLTRVLEKARKQGEAKGLEVECFDLVPDESPVCAHDPRSSLFVSQDGRVTPCMSLAYGGPSSFLGRAVEIPTLEYGRLPDQDLLDIWQRSLLRVEMSRTFDAREGAYDRALKQLFERELDLVKLKLGLEAVRNVMPPAPQGCAVCHYLFGI